MSTTILRRLSGAPLAFVVRVAGRGLAFGSTVIVARALGVEDYGVYAFAIAWTAILIPPSVLGAGPMLVRFVPVYRARDAPGLVAGVIRYAHRIVVPASLALTGVAAAAAALWVDRTYAVAVLVALAIVPLRALTAIRSGVLQGLRRPELSFLPVYIVFPLALMAAVLTLLAAGIRIDAELAVAAAVAATGVGLLVTWAITRSLLRPLVGDADPVDDSPAWRRAIGPFTAVSIIAAASSQIGIVLLGILGSSADAGIFNAAARLAEPVGLVFLVITIANAPVLAHHHEVGDRAALAGAAHRAARASLLYSLPVSVVVIAAQQPLLGLFGPGFAAGGAALTILVGAQVVNALAGSVGNVLLMTGNGAPVVAARGGALVVGIGLAFVLIPSLGTTGAAIAVAVDMALWNFALALVAWRRLGINATALPWPRTRIPAVDAGLK